MQENEKKPPVKKSIEAYLTAFLGTHQKSVNEALEKITSSINSFRISTQPFIEQFLKIDWKAVAKELASMPASSREAMEKAADRGWFFTWENSLGETINLIKSLKQSTTEDEVDEILINHYRKNLDFYTDALSKLYPDRSDAIKAAVSAHATHQDSGYILSIPVFIAQADGILAEISGVSMPLGFDRKTKKANVSAWADKLLDSDQKTKDIIAPLLNLKNLDLFKSSDFRSNAFNALNRHQVMHGEVSNYGSELNSLKAFSLLAFFGVHVPSYLLPTSTKQVAPVTPTPTKP